MVEHLPTMREILVQSLGWEDPLEKEMATTPVLLPGISHGQRSVVAYSPWGLKELDTTEQLHFTSLQFVFFDSVPICVCVCRGSINHTKLEEKKLLSLSYECSLCNNFKLYNYIRYFLPVIFKNFIIGS